MKDPYVPETLKQGWESFYKASYPEGLPHPQARQVKAAYIAGALVMHNAILLNPARDKEDFVQSVDNVSNELMSMCQLVSKEAQAAGDGTGRVKQWHPKQ